MMKFAPALLGLAAACALSGCGIFEDARSIAKEVSKEGDKDEVTSGAPLAVPPDYSLRPPATTGTPTETSNRARVILKVDPDPRATDAKGGRPRPGDRSASEADVLRRTGRPAADGDIVRRTVDVEAERRTGAERGFTDKILKYDPSVRPTAEAADPAARDAASDRPVIKHKSEF